MDGKDAMITGINHLTFAVRSLDRSFAFYVDGLGLRPVARGPSTAYLTAGETWIALVEDRQTREGPAPEYTHAAFDVPAERFDPLVSRLVALGVRSWQENPTEGASFYFLDPDGHKLELHVGGLVERLEWARHRGGGGWTFFSGEERDN